MSPTEALALLASVDDPHIVKAGRVLSRLLPEHDRWFEAGRNADRNADRALRALLAIGAAEHHPDDMDRIVAAIDACTADDRELVAAYAAKWRAANDALRADLAERGASFHKWAAQGRDAERAAVVAYLRRVCVDRGDFAFGEWTTAADAIERGAHREGE